MSSYSSLHSLNTGYEQSTEAINWKPTQGKAPGTQFQQWCDTCFCQPQRWAAYFEKLESKDSHLSW